MKGLSTSLSVRLFLFTALALLPVFLVIGLLERQVHADRQDEVEDLVRRQTEQAGAQVDRLVEGHRTLLTAIVSAPSVRAFDPARCSAYLASLTQSLPHLNAILVLDLQGNPRCTDDLDRPTANYADRPYFRDALAEGGFVVGRHTVGRADPSATILPMAATISGEDGTVIGVAAIGLRLSHLQSLVEVWSLPPNGSLTVADEDGTILARNPLPERFVGTAIPQDFVARWVRGPAPGVEEARSQDGTWRIIAYLPATSSASGLYVSSGFARDEAFAALNRSWQWNIALVAAGLLGALLTAWIGARALIQRPVGDLVHLARAWSQGEEAGIRRPIPTREFETVAASLDAMGRAIEERSSAATRQQELLVAELHHRVKNLLGMVQAIGVQTAASVGAPPEFKLRFSERIQAIARTTDMLTVRHWEGLSLRGLVQAEIDAMPRPDAVTLHGPDIVLPPQVAISVTLIVHELATNAVKYGGISRPDGRLDVSWRLETDEGRDILDLEWRESGAAPPVPAAEPNAAGFGSKLIRRILDSVGTGGSTFGETGLVFTMRVELDQPPVA